MSEGGFCRAVCAGAALFAACSAPPRDPGDWPMVRHDTHLTARQSLPGAMRGRPAVLARYETPKTQAGVTPAPVVGDVDGDGRDEIVIAGSDGRVVALRDAGDPSTGSGQGRAEVAWELDLGMPCGPPLLADVNGDGRTDLLVAAADGVLYVLGKR